MQEPIYVVSGYMRSGTSMMMRCLEAGGLEAAFDAKRNELNDKYGDEEYKPNPAGFYELDREEYQDEDFPLMYRGKLLKCLMGGLSKFPVADYRIVFMVRDPEEIRQSYEAFFQPRSQAKAHMREFLENKYYKAIERHVSMLINRKDTEVIPIMYRDVVEKPRETFEMLKDWPIDLDKAAAVVDPRQCRFKREELTVGI